MTRKRKWMEVYGDGGVCASIYAKIPGTNAYTFHLKTGQVIGIGWRDPKKKPMPRCCGRDNPWWLIYPDGHESNGGHDMSQAFSTLLDSWRRKQGILYTPRVAIAISA